jgi:hypothetical protein
MQVGDKLMPLESLVTLLTYSSSVRHTELAGWARATQRSQELM